MASLLVSYDRLWPIEQGINQLFQLVSALSRTTRNVSAFRRGGNGFDSQPKYYHSYKDVRIGNSAAFCQMRDIKSMSMDSRQRSCNERVSWLQCFGSSAFGTVKRTSRRLLSPFPWGMIRISLQLKIVNWMETENHNCFNISICGRRFCKTPMFCRFL